MSVFSFGIYDKKCNGLESERRKQAMTVIIQQNSDLLNMQTVFNHDKEKYFGSVSREKQVL